MSAEAAIAEIKRRGKFIDYRQLLAVDQRGQTAIHSGRNSLGVWAEARAEDIASGGNLLANDRVPQAVVDGRAGDRNEHEPEQETPHERARTDAERQALLERVLVGNCLAVAKAFGHWVQGRLNADAPRLRPRTCRFKDQPMIGFEGPFRVNFLLPNGIGIGKSVSRGFGTVAAIQR